MNPLNTFRLITYLAAVLVAALCHFLPDQSVILLPIATALAGWATVHPADSTAQRAKDAGHAFPGLMFLSLFLSLSVGMGILLSGCSATTIASERNLWQSIVACAKVNPANAQFQEQALACLIDVSIKEPALCLAALPAAVTWAADDLVCAVKVFESAAAK